MNLFIWSQILAGIGMGISITSVQIKNPKVMRVMLFISSLFRGIHFLFLGVPHAGIVTFIAGSRWLTSIFTHKKIVEIFFILIILGIGWFTANGLVSLLAIIGSVLGTLAAFTENNRNMRIYLISGMILWTIHNIIVFTPVGIISALFFLISNMVGYERFYHHDHVCLYNCQPVHTNISSQ